ncbi:hypothetical protein GCM10010452_34250 [Crossiella cryophila]
METTALSVLQVVLEQSKRVLETYRIDPGLIREHANAERRITQGGYGDRQIYELVQNGADELRQEYHESARQVGGEIAVVLTKSHLYCANQGSPITPEGTDVILRMSSSRKRGGQIGRFGVGVKSVLSVSDSPEFFSATGSFGFDKEWSASRIREVQPEVDDVPVLRMARPISQERAVETDGVLAGLLKWATTVVRLPLQPRAVNGLARDLATFPAEFLLFSPHVGTVTLEDRRTSVVVRRQIFQRSEGDRRALEEQSANGASSTSYWRVFSRVHRPTDSALEAAGELHDRPEIDIAWAVPDRLGRDNKLGEFWAYFPTKYKTTLRGIVNAPWKTSEDRQNLYGGNEFNRELIRVMADLVVDSLQALTRDVDPAAYLDATPARGREEPQWASDQLVSAVWVATTSKPSLPDQHGRLRIPAEVRLHPADLKREWLELWRNYDGRPIDWVHHSVDSSRMRRASAELICNTATVPIASVREWLEALAQDGTPAASATALRIAADMVRGKDMAADEAQKARILLTESHGLVAPVRGQVFRRVSDDSLADSNVYVDDRVTVEFGVTSALDTLGIHEADAAGRFAAVVDQGFADYDDQRWTELWMLSRKAGLDTVLTVLRGTGEDPRRFVHVRTVSGRYRRLGDCLLPGVVVPGDGTRDDTIAVDLRFHGPDRSVLRDLGLIDTPRNSVDPTGEAWFGSYVEECWNRHLETLPTEAPRVQLRNVKVSGTNPPGPLHLLTELSEEGRAEFLKALPRASLISQWNYYAGGQQVVRRTVASPMVWMARKHGRLHTSKGVVPLARAVSPALVAYSDFFPVADLPIITAESLRLPDDMAALPERFWTSLLAEVAVSEDDEFPGRAYDLLFRFDVELSESIGNTRCRVGAKWTNDRPDNEIAVTAERKEYDLLVAEEVPAILVPSEETAQLMMANWGLLDPGDVVEKEFRYVEQAEPLLLTDEFPPLKLMGRNKIEGWSLVRCSELEEITHTPNGVRTESIPSAVKDRRVLVLNPPEDLTALRVVDRVLKLGLGEGGCQEVIRKRQKARDDNKIKEVRAAPTVPDKAVRLFQPEQLKRQLPDGLVDYAAAEAGQEPDHHRLAELAVAAHGDQLLHQHVKDLEERLPGSGRSFRGDSASRQLVSDLQFPDSFAGVQTAQTRSATETVSGPTPYPALHDYQERLARNMFELLTTPAPQRGMLCLPTGAGKTRIAAESVIRVIKERGLEGKPVLWIAQTDELCEQAVQSWMFVWGKVGPEERLTVSRLWSSNEAVAVTTNAHLVVATDAKLHRCLAASRYAWLRDAALVVVDEAHVSTNDTYTKLFRELGLTSHSNARPLVGLTATPFRGNNDVETRKLVDRYEGRRLDAGVFDADPYTSLQSLGMLAQVEHRELAGTTLQLTEDELQKLALPFQHNLPSTAERRLSGNSERNRMLVAEIERLPRDWPVLLFATSVNHAKLMAAILNDKGIKAAALESSTPAAQRWKIVEDYRERKIQVITNYGVLAQGFDAPATRVVIVARPTYSPNVYTQMIGRGLRGPKNGGKDTCLILDVRDNITNYRSALAFTGFEHLWSRG